MKKLRFKKRGNILYYGYNNIFRSSGLKDTKINRNILLQNFKDGLLNKDLNLDCEDVNYIPTIEKFIIEVMQDKEKNLKPKSYVMYESVYRNHIKPFFNDKLITQIKPIDIKNWHDKILSKNLKKDILVTSRAILNSAFTSAILSEHITFNPVAMVKIPKIKSSKKEFTPFNLDEIDLLLENADRELKNFLAISFFTGIRSGELLALKWSDINLDTNTITINKTISNYLITTPKTKSSNRNIEIISQVRQYINNQILLTGIKNSFVFLYNSNYHTTNKRFFYRYKDLLKKLKLDSRSLHTTRHTFASLMLNNSIEPYWVSNMLGHESLKTTLDIYSKYIPRKEIMRVDFLEKRYKSGTNHF